MAESLAHPEDILILGTYNEGGDFRMFKRNQVYSARSAAAMQGRTFRKAWYTEKALVVPSKKFWTRLRISAKQGGGEILPFKKWGPDEGLDSSEVRQDIR